MALTDEEISARSGLDIDTVRAMSSLTSWDTVHYGLMEKFLRGCGMDFASTKDMRRADQYVRKRGLLRFGYLKKNRTLWKTTYQPLLLLWIQLAKSKRQPQSQP